MHLRMNEKIFNHLHEMDFAFSDFSSSSKAEVNSVIAECYHRFERSMIIKTGLLSDRICIVLGGYFTANSYYNKLQFNAVDYPIQKFILIPITLYKLLVKASEKYNQPVNKICCAIFESYFNINYAEYELKPEHRSIRKRINISNDLRIVINDLNATGETSKLIVTALDNLNVDNLKKYKNQRDTKLDLYVPVDKIEQYENLAEETGYNFSQLVYNAVYQLKESGEAIEKTKES